MLSWSKLNSAVATAFGDSNAMVHQQHPLCYVGCAPAVIPSSSARSQCSQRIAVSPHLNDRFRRYMAKRMLGPSAATRFGGIVFEHYLGCMERAYFGRSGARACAPLPVDARDRDAVIFDMDGVLCDSEQVSRVVAAAVFRKEYNLKVEPEEFAPFTGTGEANFLKGVANKYNVKDFDVEMAKHRFFDLYVNGGYTLKVKIFPGIKGLVQRIKDLGLKVGVASAADRVKVDANLRAIGLPRESFDFVTSSDDIVNKKPAPDVFLAAATGLGVDASRCTVVEDAVAGVQAARAAQMRCIAVATSLEKEALRDAGADVVRDEPALIEVGDVFERDVFAAVEETA